MGLNKAPCTVTRSIPIIKSKEGDDDFKGGILKGTKYAWLCRGPFLTIVDVLNGEKVAGWRFGARSLQLVNEVSCAVELPNNGDNINIRQIVIGLQCETIGGMICVFDIQGSRLLRAIRLPGKPLSLSIVDSGSSGCEGRYPLPSLLSSMSGIIAIGLEGGKVFLVDLCRLSCDELLNTWFNDDREELYDEMNPCNLQPISKDDEDSDLLEKKRAAAAISGDHLCLHLNGCAFMQDTFLLFEHGGDVVASFKTENVGVTSLLYEPRIASLAVGFSFGCFQLWNLMQLTLNYTSHIMKDPLPVVHLGFQEPSDDPCNFCYLWAVHSGTDGFPTSSTPVGIMYALSYDSKEWVDGYGYLYQDFQSCRFRFEYNLNIDTSEDIMRTSCVSFNTLSNMTIQKNMSEDGFDEASSENDFSLCVFSWEAYNLENKPVSTYLSLFDLNQWYKDQMPVQVHDDDGPPGFIVTFSLNSIRQNVEELTSDKPTLLDVKVDSSNLSQFKSFQPQEEHFHPSALSFVSYCLLEDRVVSVTHPGLQKYILLFMEKEGPMCLLRPSSLFKHSVMVGLKPVLVDINAASEVPLSAQREYLLSVALENQMLGFLHRCASDWANGSVSGIDCSLPMLLSWGFQRAVILKGTADDLCVHLFDHTGIQLDKNECHLLDNCASQLRQLATLFEGILNDSRLLSIVNMEDFKEKTCELSLVALYFEVLLWFLNVRLLPEFPEHGSDSNEDDSSDLNDPSVVKVAYPASAIAKIYESRRQEFKTLNYKNGTKASLYIDQLLENENGFQLSELWKSDGGSGMYPPPSIQSLLAMYLQSGIDNQTKNSIVIYVFLDLASILDNEKYSSIIEYFVKFPCAFCMTPSIIKVTQAFWLLDQKHFEDALDMVLDPLVSAKDLQPWQHRFIVHSLLAQNQHAKALEYFTLRQLPIQGIEDIQLKITLLVVNKQVTQAYNFLQQYLNEVCNKDLLLHFFQECGKAHQLGTVLKLMLTPDEEELFMNYLQNCNISRSEDMQVVFYLMRSRIIEAVAVNERINFSNLRKPSSLGRTRNDPTIRDILVDGYAKTLPSVTKQLANYCSQQKKALSSWRQIQRPTPMSVDVHYGTTKSVSYKSSLIHATLEKARETWMLPVLSPFSSEARQKESMDVTSMKNLPFLCTSHDSLKFDREATPVVFPSLTTPGKRRYDDDYDDGSTLTPLKRSRLENSPPVESFLLPNKRKEQTPTNNNSVLLKSPLVKRITPLRQQRDIPYFGKSCMGSVPESFTPHSILRVRSSDRCSVSPDRFHGSSNLTKAAGMDVDKHSEEKLHSRQIRFSIPAPNEEVVPLSSSTPSYDSSAKSSPSSVHASPRLPIRSSLSLLKKSLLNHSETLDKVGESENKVSFSVDDNKTTCKSLEHVYVFDSAASSDEVVNQLEAPFSTSSTTKPEESHENQERGEWNKNQGDDSFYSAGSSDNSSTTQEDSKVEEEDEKEEREEAEDGEQYDSKKYIHDIKDIKPRRQLSRLKTRKQITETVNSETKVIKWREEEHSTERSDAAISVECENDSEVAHFEMSSKSILGDTFVDDSFCKYPVQVGTDDGNSDVSDKELIDSFVNNQSCNESTEVNAENSIGKLQEIKGRRPLSRLANSGNLDTSFQNSSKLLKSWHSVGEKDLGSNDIEVREGTGTLPLGRELLEDTESCVDSSQIVVITTSTSELSSIDNNRSETFPVDKTFSDEVEAISDEKNERLCGVLENVEVYPELTSLQEENDDQISSSTISNIGFSKVERYPDMYEVMTECERKVYTSLTNVADTESANYEHVLPAQEAVMIDNNGMSVEESIDKNVHQILPGQETYSMVISYTIGNEQIHEPSESLCNEVLRDDIISADDGMINSNQVILLTDQGSEYAGNISPCETVEKSNTIDIDSDESREKNGGVTNELCTSIPEEIVISENDSTNYSETEVTNRLPSISSLINLKSRSNKEIIIVDSDSEPDYVQMKTCENRKENLIHKLKNKDIIGQNVLKSMKSRRDEKELGQDWEVEEANLPHEIHEDPIVLKLSDSENEGENICIGVKNVDDNVVKSSNILDQSFLNENHSVESSQYNTSYVTDMGSESFTKDHRKSINVTQSSEIETLNKKDKRSENMSRKESVSKVTVVFPESTSKSEQKHVGIVDNKQRRKSYSVQSEPPDMNDFIESEQNLDVSEGSSSISSRLRRRRSSIHCDSPVSVEVKSHSQNNAEEKQTSTPSSAFSSQLDSIPSGKKKLNETIQIGEDPGVLTRQRRRRSSIQCDSPIVPEKIGLADKSNDLSEVVSSPRTKQKSRRHSIQSEHPLVSTPENLNQDIQVSHSPSNLTMNLRSRRSFLQSNNDIDSPELGYGKRETENNTPKSRQRRSPSSVQSEPPLLSDVMGEIQDENVFTPKKHGKQKTRRNSIQTMEENSSVVSKLGSNFIAHVSDVSTLPQENPVKHDIQHKKTKSRVETELSKISDSPTRMVLRNKAGSTTQLGTNLLASEEKQEKLSAVRSLRSRSVDRDSSFHWERSEEASDSDTHSVQSEPPNHGDVLESKQHRSQATKKGSSKKKSHRVSYFLRIPPPKLSALKEEPENELSGEAELSNDNKSKYVTSDKPSVLGNLRSRKGLDSETSHSRDADADEVVPTKRELRKRTDSLSSISSKSTIVLDQSNKRKRSSSPSSPEKHEVKKLNKNIEDNARASDGAPERLRKKEHSDDTIEQYATARRLTRYQKNVMERSIDSTKGVSEEYRVSHETIDKSGGDSDGESVASGYTTNSSPARYVTRLQERKQMIERSPSLSSQASSNISPQRRVTKHHLLVREDTSGSSPASVHSERSSTASSSQWPSPTSISPRPVRPRRKSLQKANRTLFSPTKKYSTRSATTDTSEAESVSDDERSSVVNPSEVNFEADTGSEAGSLISHSSRRSSSSRSSAKNIHQPELSSKMNTGRRRSLSQRSRKQEKVIEDNLKTPSVTKGSLHKGDSPQEATTSQDVTLSKEETQEDVKPERRSYSIFKKRKFLKLQTKKKM